MQLTEQQKSAILKIADFLAERNSEDIIYFSRDGYGFYWYDKDSKYHNLLYNSDTIQGFQAFYDESSDNEKTFCNCSDLFKQIMERAEHTDSNFSEIWDDFIYQLKNGKDFYDARDYALMRSVVCYEQPDLYTLKEVAELLRDYEQQDDILRVLYAVCYEYQNFEFEKEGCEEYLEAFKEIGRMLEEDEED